jgi:hypothetical protein
VNSQMLRPPFPRLSLRARVARAALFVHLVEK